MSAPRESPAHRRALRRWRTRQRGAARPRQLAKRTRLTLLRPERRSLMRRTLTAISYRVAAKTNFARCAGRSLGCATLPCRRAVPPDPSGTAKHGLKRRASPPALPALRRHANMVLLVTQIETGGTADQWRAGRSNCLRHQSGWRGDSNTMRRCHALDPGMPVISSTCFGFPPQPSCVMRLIRSPPPITVSRDRQVRLV
jgi:hypothetical protein